MRPSQSRGTKELPSARLGEYSSSSGIVSATHPQTTLSFVRQETSGSYGMTTKRSSSLAAGPDAVNTRAPAMLKFRSSFAYKLVSNLVAAVVALVFFFLPGLTVVRDIADPAMRRPGIPSKAWRMHRYLTPLIERWARERIASKRAAHLNLYDVPSTEWPMFTCVFYLRTTEVLQDAWEKDHTLAREAPLTYARGAVETAKDLIVDPIHHTWVRQHWGDDYRHTQNVFFRSLVISGITSYEKLVGHGELRSRLLDEVDTLADALDRSKLGVLEDY